MKQEEAGEITSFYKNSVIRDFYVFDNSNPESEKNQTLRRENMYVDHDSVNHIRIMKKFKAPRTETHDSKYARQWETDMQNEFFLRCYLPKSTMSAKSKADRINRVIIMFNGLNEFQDYSFYDHLGSQFASQGYASILLPTPYHLNRRIRSADGSILKPTEHAAANGLDMMYFYSFQKSMEELQELLKSITSVIDNGDHGFYQNYFNQQNLRVTLFGFSLGGVKALASMLCLKDYPMLHSCILFNAAIGLSNTTIKYIDRNPEQIKQSIQQVHQLLPEIEQCSNYEMRRLARMFNWLCFPPEPTKTDKDPDGTNQGAAMTGDHDQAKNKAAADRSEGPPAVKRGRQAMPRLGPVEEADEWVARFRGELESLASKCLFIQSANDQAVGLDLIRHIIPEGGIHQVIVPGADHVPQQDLTWGQWMSKIAEYMVSFLQDDVSIGRMELLSEIHGIIAKTPFYKCKEDLMKELHRLESIGRKKNTKEDQPKDNQPEIDAIRQELGLRFTLEHLKQLEAEIDAYWSDQAKEVRTEPPSPSRSLRFRELYYLSKAFYPKFPELVEALVPEMRIAMLKSRGKTGKD